MHWRPVLRAATVSTTLTVYAAGQDAPPEPAEPLPETALPESSAPGAESTPGAEGEPAPGAAEDPAEPPEPEPAAPGGAANPAKPAPPLGPPPGEEPPEEYQEPELPMTPPAPDSLGGHFVLGAGAAWVVPFGRLGSEMSQASRLDDGWGVTLDAGLGVSRQVVVGAWGQLSMHDEGSACNDCSATSFAVGPFVRYHLVQGLRFDPWLSFAVGYRSTSLEDSGETVSFSGVEWARLQIGGDWYAARSFGMGPFLELSSGGFLDRPETAGDLRAYWNFLIGLRLVLDIPGRLK